MGTIKRISEHRDYNGSRLGFRARNPRKSALAQLNEQRKDRPSQKARERWFSGMVDNGHKEQLPSRHGSEGLQVISYHQGMNISDLVTNQPIAFCTLLEVSPTEAAKERRKLYAINKTGKHQFYTRYYDNRYLQITRMK